MSEAAPLSSEPQVVTTAGDGINDISTRFGGLNWLDNASLQYPQTSRDGRKPDAVMTVRVQRTKALRFDGVN
jgi:hypothetical protein